MKWTEILTELCKINLSEDRSVSYYWSQDEVDDDTLWAIEGFTHPIGFFKGHVSTSGFIEQNKIIEEENLLPNGYNLYYYDFAGGWLTRDDDVDKDLKSSHVVVHHFWPQKGNRDPLVQKLLKLAEQSKSQASHVQSCAVLVECDGNTLVTLWLRYVFILVGRIQINRSFAHWRPHYPYLGQEPEVISVYTSPLICIAKLSLKSLGSAPRSLRGKKCITPRRLLATLIRKRTS